MPKKIKILLIMFIVAKLCLAMNNEQYIKEINCLRNAQEIHNIVVDCNQIISGYDIYRYILHRFTLINNINDIDPKEAMIFSALNYAMERFFTMDFLKHGLLQNNFDAKIMPNRDEFIRFKNEINSIFNRRYDFYSEKLSDMYLAVYLYHRSNYYNGAR